MTSYEYAAILLLGLETPEPGQSLPPPVGVKVSSLTHRLEIDSLEIKNSLKTVSAAAAAFKFATMFS